MMHMVFKQCLALYVKLRLTFSKSHKRNSRCWNCLSPMNTTHRLPSNNCQPTNTISYSRPSNTATNKIILILTILILAATSLVTGTVITSVEPSIIPIQGKVTLYIKGEGFHDVVFPKCQIHTVNGVIAIDDNTIISDTQMKCTLSTTSSIQRNSIMMNGNMANLRVITGINGSLQLTFFDQDSIMVSGINPDWTYTSSHPHTMVSIFGNGFIDTNWISCYSSLFEVAAVFVNESLIMCRFPSQIETLMTDIAVYSVGQPESIIQGSESLEFTYFATPPVVLSFQFNPSYTSLVMQFDREVELGNETIGFNLMTFDPIHCDILFDLHIFGTPGPTCLWKNTQQRELIIHLNSDNSTVQPNTSVPLVNDVIRTRYVTYSKLTTGIVTITEDGSNPLYPVGIIEGPQYIPYCGSIILSGRKSYNGGSRPLQFLWNLTVANDDDSMGASGDADISEYITYTNLIPDDLVRSPTITLMADSFNEDISYHLTLTVTNFLGRVDEKHLMLTKQTQPGLNTWILGDSHIVVDSTVPLYIEGMTNIPMDCTLTISEVTYTWVLYKEGSVMEIDESIATTNQYIQLKPYTLMANTTYTLTFQATISSSSSIATVTIQTLPVQFQAIIFGGSTVVRGIDNQIILDSTDSIGLSDPLLTIHWSCVDESSQLLCSDTNNQPAIGSSEVNQIQTVIPAGILLPTAYVFTLELLYADSVVSTNQQVVDIRNDTDGPSVYITHQPTTPINIHDTLLINGMVESSGPGVVTWTSVYKPGYAYLTLTEYNNVTTTPITLNISATNDDTLTLTMEHSGIVLLTSNTTTTTPYVNPYTLSILPNTLLPNNKYCFRLTATPIGVPTDEISSRSRYAEVEISTAAQPSSGYIHVSPLTGGYSLDTVFIITAVDWVDYEYDYPLYYRYGFIMMADDGEDTIWLTGKTQEDTLSTILPYSFSDDDSALMVVVEISNSHNATTTVTNEIVVTMETIDLSDIDDQIRNKVSGGVANLNQYFSYLVSTLYMIDSLTGADSLSGGMSVAEFKSSMATLLLDLYDASFFPHNTWSQELLVNVIKSLTSDDDSLTLSDTHLVRLIQVLEDIVSERLIINVGVTNDLITIYGNLINSNSIIEYSYSRTRADAITTSFDNVFKGIGRLVCQNNAALFAPSQYITNNVLGSVKVYNGLLLSLYNVSCDHTLISDCPLANITSSSVHIGLESLKQIVESSCGDYEHGTEACSSYCYISRQLGNDIHWSGSPYASIVKSYPVSHYLVSTRTNEEVAPTGSIIYNTVLKYPRSPWSRGELECAYWNEDINEWSQDGCTLLDEVSSSSVDSSVQHVRCSCQHFKEVAVIDRCLSGYYGMKCDKVCPYGLYGEECSQQCDCSTTGLCSPYNGSCDCSPGWTGAKCDSVCPTDTWGKYCIDRCQCQNGASCDPINGGCGCTPGWIGQYCDIECPEGFYGDNCTSNCTCHSDTECDFITGTCTCEPGYTGTTCHDPCSNGYYGLNCTSECSCVANGTVECDNVNGTCYCKEMWSGDDCEIEPYSPPLPPAPKPFPILLAVVPPIAGLLCAGILIALIVLVCVLHKKHRKKRVTILPVDAPAVNGDKEGDRGSNSEDDELELTRAKSKTLIVPEGKTLKDMFRNPDKSLEFKEPEVIGNRKRWQIIQVLPSTTNPPTIRQSPLSLMKDTPTNDEVPEKNTEKMKVESGIEIESIDGDDQHNTTPATTESFSESNDDAQYSEIVYPKGIYTDSDATLKDLRNAFIDSAQLDPGSVLFRFLNSDIPGDYIEVDSEEETLLTKLEATLLSPRTVYIELVDKNSVALELCVCGKFAELECNECRAKGYCSDQCQQDHWMQHSSTCRIVSARRRKAKKMKKKRKKLEKMMRRSSGGYTPHPDKCPCGNEAQYECSECGKQGYCSEKCQQEDWELHQLFCEGREQQDKQLSLGIIIENENSDENTATDNTLC